MSDVIKWLTLDDDGARFAADLTEVAADGAVRAVAVEIDPAFGSSAGAGLERSVALSQVCLAMFDCPKPIVGVANGRLSGWALTAAASADLLVVTRGTVFGAEAGGDATATGGPLAFLLPPRLAKWLVLGAGELSAEEGLDAGFVTRVADEGALQAVAGELLERIALVPADVLAAKKAAHVYDMEVEGFRSVLGATAEFDALASAR